jgi:putative ABC transport system permease protein
VSNPFRVSPRWRKVLRDLGTNKARTALVVVSIAVGVFAVGAVTSTSLQLSADLSRVYRATNPANAIIFPRTPIDDELVRSVRRVEGVADAEGVQTATMRVKTGPDEWRTLVLTARQDFTYQRMDTIAPERGAWPPPRHEILVERNAFSLLKAEVGDTLTVQTPDRKLHEVPLAGLAYDVSAPPAMFSGSVQGFATLETLEWLGQPRTFTQLRITVSEHADDVASIQQVADRVKHKVEQTENSVQNVRVPTPGNHPAKEIIDPLLLILTVFGASSLFLSGFLVVNTVTALLTQQVPLIGVMKAIGARTGQLFGMYLGTVFVYGLLSLLVAAPLGAAAGFGLTWYLAGLLNVETPFAIQWPVVALEAVLAVLIPLIAALWPVFTGTHLTVREALNAEGAGAFGRGLIDRALERLQGLPRPLLLSLRNTFRRKGRLALTLTTLTLGGAVFIGVLTLRSSMLATLDDTLDYWRYDVSVAMSGQYRTDQMNAEALQVPGVTAAESWASAGVQRLRPDGHDGISLEVIAPPADTTMILPTLLEGRWLLPDDQDAIVLNTAVLQKEPDLKVGDTVTFKLGKKETSWRIVGLARATLSGPVAYANLPAFSRLNGAPGRAGHLVVTTAQHDAATQTAVAAALKTRLEESRLQVVDTRTVSSIREGIELQFNIIIALMLAMAVLMAVVGGLGLMGTMSINVIERAREIGVMRAIGASTATVLGIFLVEGTLIGALSWLAATALSLPLSRLMSAAIGQTLFQAELSYAFSVPGVLLWLVLVLTLAALATLLPALRASRLTVRAVLAYS